jgi:hypothetical protein
MSGARWRSAETSVPALSSNPGLAASPREVGRLRHRVLAGAALVVLILMPVLAVATPPASAASRSSPGVPTCPPDCGALAAGDPLLIPYLIDNPGTSWSVLPAADVQSYVDALKRGIGRVNKSGVVTNVAAGKWQWTAGGYSLMVVLVSSSSLAAPHLESPVANAQDLCAASRGQPTGHIITIAGIPHSVAGVCAMGTGSSGRVATVVAFNRADVAVLIEVISGTSHIIDQRITTFAAQEQYLALPAGGVLVSHGSDIELLFIWLVLLAAIVVCVVLCIRRRGSWRGPFTAITEAFGRRRLALGITVVAGVGAMAFSMLDFSLLHGFGRWYESGFNDFWRTWSTSNYMTFGGGYTHIYALNTALETAPTVQVLLAPIARLASGLPFPDPGDVLYPTAFWVAGPLFLSAIALPLCAGDRWLQYMGVTGLRRRVAVLGTMAITLPPIALGGHPEDLIALGAMLYGLIAALEDRPRAVGWWLGVALAFQFLAFLAIPMALLLLTRRQWLRAIIPMVVVPLSVLVVPLVGDLSVTVHQLFHQKVYDDFGYITPTWHLDPGVAALIRGLVALAAIPAAIAVKRALPDNRSDAANLIVWMLASLWALRVWEPELVPYFLAPSLALLAVSAARAPWWRLAATGLLAVWLNWWLHDPIQARWSAWLFLVAQLCILTWLAWPQNRGLPADTRPAVTKKPNRTPVASRR